MHARLRLVAALSSGVVHAACAEPPPVSHPPPPAAAAPTPAAGSAPLPTPLEVALRFDFPEPAERGDALTLWATNYYVPVVHDLSAGAAEGHDLLDVAGEPLGPRLSKEDWCNAALQGTVRVAGDARIEGTYNYAGVTEEPGVDCATLYPSFPAIGRTRFMRAIGRWGDGVEGMILVPFRSMAVDPSIVELRSVLYVPAARGERFTLPDGTERTHDGYFFAADRGGAIRGHHVDVFTGTHRDSPLGFVTSKRDGTFEARIVPDGPAVGALRRAHQRTPG